MNAAESRLPKVNTSCSDIQRRFLKKNTNLLWHDIPQSCMCKLIHKFITLKWQLWQFLINKYIYKRVFTRYQNNCFWEGSFVVEPKRKRIVFLDLIKEMELGLQRTNFLKHSLTNSSFISSFNLCFNLFVWIHETKGSNPYYLATVPCACLTLLNRLIFQQLGNKTKRL